MYLIERLELYDDERLNELLLYYLRHIFTLPLGKAKKAKRKCESVITFTNKLLQLKLTN